MVLTKVYEKIVELLKYLNGSFYFIVCSSSVNPKGNQSWIFIGRTDAEAETKILWPPDVKNWLIWKDPDAGKDWGQEEKGTTEDETVGWHYRLDGHGFGWTLGVSDGQGGLVCCSPWGGKELDRTEWLSWTSPEDTTAGKPNPARFQTHLPLIHISCLVCIQLKNFFPSLTISILFSLT